MSKTSRIALSIAMIAAAGSIASAQPTATFSYLPEGCVSANDMSPDGRYIVGGWDPDGDNFPNGSYLYDTLLGTIEVIATGAITNNMENARAVSDDGAVVTGNTYNASGIYSASVWNSGSGWSSVGALPGADCDFSLSSAWELSGDGSTIVGFSWKNGCEAAAFKWTQGTGMVELEYLFNGTNRASVVSADGSVIAGFAQGTQNRTPAYWDGNTGDGYLIDPTAVSIGEVHGMSDDGSVLLLEYLDWDNIPKDSLGDAYKWTAGGGLELIGTGSISGGWTGIPMDIAEDTGTIVGFDIILGNRRAWIQLDGQGDITELVSFVNTHGGTVPVGQTLQVCQAITRDGTRIIGHTAGTRAWMVTLEYPCQADMNGDGILDNGDIGGFIGLFLTQDLAADFNGDGILDNGDIGAFVAAFLAGC